MTRVLISVDAIGGVWTYALELARALRPLGVTTTLAVLGPAPSADQSRAAIAVPDLHLVQTGARPEWLARDEPEMAAAAAALAVLAERTAASLVQLNSPALASLACFRVPVVGVCHSCVGTWWDAVRSGPMPADFAWRTAVLQRGYAACDTLVAPSAAFAATVAAYAGIRPAVVHNGIAAPDPVVAPRARMVLTAGRLWDEGKNLATLDRCAALLDAPVYAAGKLTGPQGQTVAVRHVRLMGQLSATALRAHMQQALVFAALPRYEPFGLAILEAAQSGCALVLADIPTLRELWDGAALFVPPHDTQAARTALATLLDDPAHAARAAAAAQARARSYQARPMALAMRGIYRTVLKQRQAA